MKAYRSPNTNHVMIECESDDEYNLLWLRLNMGNAQFTRQNPPACYHGEPSIVSFLDRTRGVAQAMWQVLDNTIGNARQNIQQGGQ